MADQVEPTIAVIDDDDDVGDVLRGLLEFVGHEVVTYRSGVEFLADEQRERVGCMVIDQNMPEMTGFQLLTRLRLLGNTTPSLLITGTYDKNIARQALELGVMKVLAKPMQTSELLRLVSFSIG